MMAMRFRLVCKVWCFLLAVCVATGCLAAQVERYELGLRLRAFERRLDSVTDEARRVAAFGALDRAVQAFFRLDTMAVAKAIDDADCALAGGGWSVAVQYAHSLQWQLQARLVAAGDAVVEGKLSVAYRIEDEDFEPVGWSLVVRVPGVDEATVIPLDELPQTISIPLVGVPAGDHMLKWSLVQGEQVLLEREQALSVVANLADRMAGLVNAQKLAKAQDPATIESKTLPSLVKMLKGLQRRRAAETILPGDRILKEAEALSAWLSGPQANSFYGGHRPGSFRLRIPVGKRTTSVRLFVPKVVDKAPLVVALHGAGGSENLFFDGYGDGRVVDLSAERTWLVVAPRLTLGSLDCAALVDALAQRFPIDTKRVLMVGHSMGAMQAIANAVRAPERYQAVAALGGGGQVRRSEGLKKLRFFVGVGTKDFARAGANGLHRALEAAGASSDFREYAEVEHLAIVQLALADVFRFFDKVLAR
ncbi:MAG: pimeloyl-ACP methyl ester carboxylesterase [Hyphomicrobiaceae bacterium]|jgi:pimeloyl-ACP methyl ester carboxylesterase